jgi:hypothetical protein
MSILVQLRLVAVCLHYVQLAEGLNPTMPTPCVTAVDTQRHVAENVHLAGVGIVSLDNASSFPPSPAACCAATRGQQQLSQQWDRQWTGRRGHRGGRQCCMAATA